MVTLGEILLWLPSFVVADVIAMMFMDWLAKRRDRDLDIGCDNCDKPHPLKKAPGVEKRWLCRICMKAYIADHEAEFIEAGITPEQIRKAFSGYRRRKRSNKKK